MKITCHACDAKYTIADEKVTGRTVKIKCKKCGATIVVNADTAPQMGGAAASPYSDPPAQGPGDDDGLAATRVAGMDGAPPAPTAAEWTVSMSGEDERQMSQLQIAEEMQRGRITGDTYVWRDGMADWLAVSQIPELSSLLARYATPAAPAAPAYVAAPAPAVADENQGLAGTIVMTEGAPSPFAAPRPAAGAPAAVQAPVAAAAPSPLAAANPPTAARRANRGGASVDVFTAAQEQPRAERERPKPPTPAGKLGERNENSVLFSLSALTATESAAAKTKPDEGIDLGLGNGKSGGGGGFDDLMNIGGGAIGGPMLAPPPLLAPVVEPPPAAVAPAPVAAQAMSSGMSPGMSPMIAAPVPQQKSKTGLIIGVIAAVVVLGGVGAVFALGGSSGSGSAQTDATTTATTKIDTPANSGAAAPTTTVNSAPTDTPVASGTPSSAVGSGDPGTKPVTGGGGTPGTTPTGKATSSAAATASAKATSEPAPTATQAATTAPDPGAGGGRDFNKGAATTALSAAANAAKGCKQAGGPTGSASVRVVFAPSGNVTSANVQGPPFAGTPVGGCIASAFRGAHVPPFDGSPVAVSKTVNIN